MAERKRNRHDKSNYKSSDSSGGNFRTVSSYLPSELPRRQDKKRAEESIFVANSSSMVQHAHFTGGMPMWQPFFAHQAVLNPYYFHRPIQESQRRVHTTVRSADTKSVEQFRFWEQLAKVNKKSGFAFTVMSYNVLAQDLVDQHLYLYTLHRKEDLKWNVRWNNLLAEINHQNPDILCLQEVQKSHLYTYFSVLENLGYHKLYKQRTGVRTDGCAIFYKQSVLNMIEFTTVEYKQPRVSLLDRDNVAIIAKFRSKTNKKLEFVLATTHLLYNPRRQDVRLAQTQLLLTEIDRIAFKTSGQYIPVIVTGDLNSTPSSAVYNFITKGKLRYEHLSARSLQAGDAGAKTGKSFLPSSLRITDHCQHADLLPKRKNNISMSRTEELTLIELKHTERPSSEANKETNTMEESHFSTGTLRHNLFLKSVYDHGKNGDVEGTTFQDEWLSVDYIFYSQFRGSPETLTLLERYRLPTKSELGDIKIPNSHLGSDHLSLLAKFHLQM